MGFDESDCPLPCEIFSTETKQIGSGNNQDWTGFIINFQQNLEVKSDKLMFHQKVHHLFKHAGDYNSNHKTNFVQFFVRCKYKLLKFIEYAQKHT